MFSSKYRATALSVLSLLIGSMYICITAIHGPIMEYFDGVKTMYTMLGLLAAVTVLPFALQVHKKDLLAEYGSYS